MNEPEIRLLEEAYEKVWDIAGQMNLDCYPTHFEVVPPQIMYEFGSYGLPGRFSHWTHGKAYNQMKTMYDYGLSKIYELVINTNPCQAFLMDNNSVIQNVMVMAHVLGHCDFFKNNRWFRNTNRQMTDSASVNAERIRKYEFQHGPIEVERFLDAVLSIQEHIDPNLDQRPNASTRPDAKDDLGPPVTPFDDLWMEPEDPTRKKPGPKKFPADPEKDLLWFLANYSPTLEDWQRDIIFIVRSEMLYFVPQMQTKCINEGWACATGESLLATERGFIRFRDIYRDREPIAVSSGDPGAVHPITAFHMEEQVPTLRITTRRGYTIEGAFKHRVQQPDGTWAYLSDLQVGDSITLARGAEVWAEQPVPICHTVAPPDSTLHDVAEMAETSLSTVIRYRAGRPSHHAVALEAALATTAYAPGRAGKVMSHRRSLIPPPFVNESLAHLMGYFVGDGNITKSGICLTCGDEEYARYLSQLVTDTLGIPATLRDDRTITGPRWRIEAHSRELLRLLEKLGICLDARAHHKQVPSAILRSPRSIVAAFLRGYFDADGYAGKAGVILSSASHDLVQTVQIILLNYGILSTQRSQADGCWHLEITGASAARFSEVVGFGLDRKQKALDVCLESKQWFRPESASDEIVRIEPGCADVFDITVDEAHAYVANGMVNHNSFWHLRIMREMDLPTGDYIEFANLHSGVLSPSPRRFNPYYVGLKVLEDIERRWDNPSEEERDQFKRPGGQGREKLFEVRELENDVSFLRNYLTKELVEDLDLYIYENHDDEWVIVEKDWRKVRDTIVHSMTNFGHPYITVQDGDYRGNRELLLKHHFEGRELDLDYAEKVLRHIQFLWGRKVFLETARPNGTRILLAFDGVDNTTMVL